MPGRTCVVRFRGRVDRLAEPRPCPPGHLPETKRNSETASCGSGPGSGKSLTAKQDPRVAHVRGRARHVPDQTVAYGGERSLTGTPTSRLTRTIVVKAVPEKYS